MSAYGTPLEGLLRIGAFSQKLGVSESVLRAWETRYGLFEPVRTPGGYRLYSPADELRARRMLTHLGRGLAARESARLALLDRPAPASVTRLLQALGEFDVRRAHAELDAVLASPDRAAAVTREVLPAFTAAAAEWMRSDLGPAQVQFASRLLEARLLALGEHWHEGSGPLALIGCGPGEQHTLGALALALGLQSRGWRVAYLGADTAIAAFAGAARSLVPERVVISFTVPWTIAHARQPLRNLVLDCGIVLAGRATGTAMARRLGAQWLPGDPLAVAEAL
jgi:DNA-binding transcriptional MerR regulator